MSEAQKAASLLRVEDDRAIRVFNRVLLEQLGHRVYDAFQGWNSIRSSINWLRPDPIRLGSSTERP